MKNFKIISLLSLVLLFSLSSNIFCMKRKRDIDQRDTQEQARPRKKRKYLVSGYLVSGAMDGTIKIFDRDKAWEEKTIDKRKRAPIRSVAFSPYGRYLASGSVDGRPALWTSVGTIRIFDRDKDYKVVKIIDKHTDYVYSVAFSPDGRYLASGSKDKTIKIFDIDEDWKEKTIGEHTDYVYSVAFSPNFPDSRYLVSGSKDGTIKIFDIDNDWKEVKTIDEHVGAVYSIAFSPKGRYFASGFKDKTIKIFDTKTWEVVKTIDNTHTRSVRSVAFSPDGQYLISGSSDKTIKIFAVDDNWKEVKTIDKHAGPVFSVAFSSDGQYLVSGSYDGTIKIFKIFYTNFWGIKETIEQVKEVETIEHTGGLVYSVAFPSKEFHLETPSLQQGKLGLLEDLEMME